MAEHHGGTHQFRDVVVEESLTTPGATLPTGANLSEDGGDIVIKDSNGNIVLRYDEGTSEWQFQSETLTGIGSLATEDLDIDGLSKGSTTSLVDAEGPSNAEGDLGTQPTDSVSTSAAVIYTAPGGALLRAGMLLVQGDEDGSASRFTDIVHIFSTGDEGVVNSLEFNTPAGRTYAWSTGDVTLAMASGTYDINVAAIFTARDLNATS